MQIECMGKAAEIFDVKQHPLKYGELTALEKSVAAIEKRFAAICESDLISGSKAHYSGFRTKQGTRFFVNGIYEWNTVFLEYDDGEDGDMVSLDRYAEEEAFQYLYKEVLISESND